MVGAVTRQTPSVRTTRFGECCVRGYGSLDAGILLRGFSEVPPKGF